MPVGPIFTHATSAPIRITATVQSACSFIGNAGNTVTMSCSFNTPLAAAFIGTGLLAGPRNGTFALSASGTLSEQNLNPFCSVDLSIPPDTPSAGDITTPAPYFSTFEVCF